VKKIILAAVISAISAHSVASVIYADRAAWQTAVSSISTVTFEGYANANSFSYVGTAFTSGAVNFASPEGMYVVGQNYSEGGGKFGVGSGAVLFSYNSGITGTLPGNFNAFGVNLRGYNEASTPFTITFSDGEVFNLTATNPAGAFFGVILNNKVGSFSIDPAGPMVAIDNVSFAQSAVPEPATVALFGLGLLGFAASRRKAAKK
jgi:hypothetical protein